MKKLTIIALILATSSVNAGIRVGNFVSADLYEAVLTHGELNCLYVSPEGYASWEVFTQSCPSEHKIFVENK